MTAAPLIEKGRLDAIKEFLEWFLIIIGIASLLLPAYVVYFGAAGIAAFALGYYSAVSYRKWRLEKARQKTPAKVEPLKPLTTTKAMTLASNARFVTNPPQAAARRVIKQRVVGLRRSFTEYTIHVKKGEKLHLKWDSDKPFVLHLLDSWHSSRSDFTTTLLSEPLAVKAEETIICTKTDRLTLLMASTAKHPDPRVSIEAWIE